MIIEVPVQAGTYNYNFSIELDGDTFLLELKYNERAEVWSLNVSDINSNPIIVGIALLTDVNFFEKYKMEGKPAGLFLMVDRWGGEENADLDTIGESVKLVYIDASDLE